MEAKDDVTVLRCGVCGHDHEQGVKCTICGHTGKSRSYKCFQSCLHAFDVEDVHGVPVHGAGVRLSGAEGGSCWDCCCLRASKFGPVDLCSTLTGTNFSHYANSAAGRLDIAAFGRIRFGDVVRPLETAEILMGGGIALGLFLFHVVGDGPMGVTRWRAAADESGCQVAIIECFGIVESKRQQGFARRFLRAVIEDIEAIYAQQPTHPQALVAYVPHADSFGEIKLFQSIGFQPDLKMEVGQDSSLFEMRMAWGCSHF